MTQITDSRYTDAALRGYTDDVLVEHLDERTNQHLRVNGAIAIAERKVGSGQGDNETLANLASMLRERHEQAAIIEALQREIERRERDEVLNERATTGIPSEVAEYIERSLVDDGLFPEFDDPEQRALLLGMWGHAALALDATEDEEALRTNRRVADRVIAAFVALYLHADADEYATA